MPGVPHLAASVPLSGPPTFPRADKVEEEISQPWPAPGPPGTQAPTRGEERTGRDEEGTGQDGEGEQEGPKGESLSLCPVSKAQSGALARAEPFFSSEHTPSDWK